MRRRHRHVPEFDDSLHAEPAHRMRGFDLGGLASDVGGVFKGIGEQAVDTVSGLAEAVTNPVDTAKGVVSLVTNPTESWPALWHGITDPIVQDWQAGNEGEAIGRGIFGVVEAVFGAKGLTKLGKLGKAGRLDPPDAPRPTPKPKLDVDAPTSRPGTTSITPSARLLDETFGTLDDADAAFARRTNVQHVFEGDQFGGRHVAPGPGRYGDVEVAELRHTPGRTWQANVTYTDSAGVRVTKQTTMFPREWSPTEVLQSIRRAEANAVDTGKTRQIGGREIQVLEGEDRGLKLVIHRDAATQEILSAHPKHVNKPFTEAPE